MFGWNEARRDGPRGLAVKSPRKEDDEDLRPMTGDDVRWMLATLGLRPRDLAYRLGEEGVRRGGAGCLGEQSPGDWGSRAFVAVCKERRLRGRDRWAASPFACCARRGVPGRAPGDDGAWFCMVALPGRVATRVSARLSGRPVASCWRGGAKQDRREREKERRKTAALALRRGMPRAGAVEIRVNRHALTSLRCPRPSERQTQPACVGLNQPEKTTGGGRCGR